MNGEDIHPSPRALTSRQRQVLDLLVAGKTNLEIAEALGISMDGAKWHVSEVLTRLGAPTREAAADYWRRTNSPAAKARRMVGAAIGLGALKVALTAASIVVAGAGIASMLATSGTLSRERATTGSPLADEAAAIARAYQVAAEMLANFAPDDGSRFVPADLVVADAFLQPNATSIRSRVSAAHLIDVVKGEDAWLVSLQSTRATVPGAGGGIELNVVLAADDGEDVFSGIWRRGTVPAGTVEHGQRFIPQRDRTTVQAIDVGPERWTLSAFSGVNGRACLS